MIESNRKKRNTGAKVEDGKTDPKTSKTGIRNMAKQSTVGEQKVTTKRSKVGKMPSFLEPPKKEPDQIPELLERPRAPGAGKESKDGHL